MERWVGKVAVVTGASSGIGLSTAKLLVHHGLIVVGLSRRKAKMEESMEGAAGPGKFHSVECDITKEENVQEAFDFIKKNVGSVHILINNAAMLKLGNMTTMESKQLLDTVNTNVLGQVHCIRQAVKIMREENIDGHVINIGSTAGHKVRHHESFEMNIYQPTKFALRALSETLQNELRDTQIRVTLVSTGGVNTAFYEACGADPSHFKVFSVLEPEDIADGIVYVLGTKPHVLIAELTIKHLHDYFI